MDYLLRKIELPAIQGKPIAMGRSGMVVRPTLILPSTVGHVATCVDRTRSAATASASAPQVGTEAEPRAVACLFELSGWLQQNLRHRPPRGSLGLFEKMHSVRPARCKPQCLWRYDGSTGACLSCLHHSHVPLCTCVWHMSLRHQHPAPPSTNMAAPLFRVYGLRRPELQWL